MANIKYLTLDGLTHFKSKLDKLFAAHISGAVTSEGISLYLNNNIATTATSGEISDDNYESIDSIQIPGATDKLAGAMLPLHVKKLNALPTVAFTKITDGTSSVEAESAADTLTLTATTGISISFTPSADKITIGHADTSSLTTKTAGPSEDVEQQAENSEEFTVPYITVDDFGHVTGLESRTITVKDTNTKTTETGHYQPSGTNGTVTKVKGSDVTNNGKTVTFLESVLVDSKKHITKATYGTINIPVYPVIPDLTVTPNGSGNVVTEVVEDGNHNLKVTKGLSVYSKGEVDEAIAAAKQYATDLELKKFDFKGNLIIDTNTTTANGPKVHNIGDIYRIPTAGTYFGSAYEYQVGDFVLCTVSGTSADAAHWASLNTNWQVVPAEDNKIGTTDTTIATIGGVAITAKIDSYSLSTHTHSIYVNQNAYGKLSDGTNNTTANATQDTLIIKGGNNISVSLNTDTFTINATDVATSGHNHDEAYSKLGHTHTEGDITGDLITKINAGTGISVGEGRTPTISLNAASTRTIGGIKIWDKTSYTVTATKSPTINKNINGGKYYAVQTDKNNKAFVYVPWENDNTTYTAAEGLTIDGTVIKTVRLTEQTVTGTMTSEVSAGKSNYRTKAPILLDNDAMYAEIQNITEGDIDALFN